MNKQEIAMSNETDLDWLARNVNDWPDSSCGHINTMKIKGITYPSWSRYSGEGKFTKDQWLTRRAELQNKPSDTIGDWRDTLEKRPEELQVCKAEVVGSDKIIECNVTYEFSGNRVILHRIDMSEQAVTARLQEATDNVLAAVPELKSDKYKFDPFISIEHNQEQDMNNQQEIKQDNGWFERGELPPAGVECEVRAKGDNWKRVRTIGVDNEGAMVVQFLDDAIPYHGNSNPNRFRPIRTERDVLIEIIASNLSGTTGKVADAILAAGFGMVGGAQ